MLCCGYTLTDFPISIRLTSLALWQSNDCPSASKATLMNMDKYFMWIHYERLHNHNKAKHNKTVCIFLGIYCTIMAHYYLWPRSHTPFGLTAVTNCLAINVKPCGNTSHMFIFIWRTAVFRMRWLINQLCSYLLNWLVYHSMLVMLTKMKTINFRTTDPLLPVLVMWIIQIN